MHCALHLMDRAMGFLRNVVVATVIGCWSSLAVAQVATVEGFVQQVLSSPDRASVQRAVEQAVDVAYLMEVALDDRAAGMTPEQLRRFAVGFRGLIADQLQVVAEQGRGGQFRVQRQATSAVGVVVTGVVSVGGRSQPVEFLVRSDAGRERVADLRFGDVMASAILADAIEQIFIATGGDIEAALSAINGAE